MQTKDKIQLTFTGLLVVCALAITGLIIRQQFFPPEPQSRVRQIENWQELELTSYRSGSKDAPAQIVEFFDYQCPFCKRVQPVVAAVQQKYGEKISVVHEHFPLSGHKYAFGAAVAAECARDQGKFESYHRLLFKNQEQLGSLSYVSAAQQSGISNLKIFSTCINNQETKARVIDGLNLGKRLNVSAIPTFLINGTLVTGSLSRQQLSSLIEEALAKAKE